MSKTAQKGKLFRIRAYPTPNSPVGLGLGKGVGPMTPDLSCLALEAKGWWISLGCSTLLPPGDHKAQLPFLPLGEFLLPPCLS